MKWGSSTQRSQYAYYSVRYDSDKDIFDNAVNIRRLLASEFPDKKVIIIAHSMGGMISRAMLKEFHPDGEAFAEWPNGGIERIISLNTPYHGTPFVQQVHGNLQLADEMRLQKIPITSGVLAFFQLTTPGTLCLAWDDYDGKFSGLDVFKNPDLLAMNQQGGNDPLLQYYTFGTTIVAAQTRGEWLLTDVSGAAVASCGYSNDGIVPKVSAHLRGTDNTVRTVEMGDSLPHGNYSHTKVYSGHGIKKDDPFSYDKVLYNEILGCLIPEPPVVTGEYLVVDLSAGPSAASYPVSTLAAAPAGGWTDEYKTTKLVLRKIPAGSFTIGSPEDELGHADNETQHQVTLTKDFYVGVFEVTQKQWELVTGNWPSYFSNVSYCDTRPVECVSYDDIRGSSAGAGWPASSAVDTESFLGRLRTRTGLDFDLPTEAQWEYACRAGTTTALNSGKNLTSTGSCPNMSEVGRYRYNGGSAYSGGGDTSVGTAKVGSYLPNQWGLYDMHGNVWEWCLDWYQSELGSSAQTDPWGAAGGSIRVLRGGSWDSDAGRCRSAPRSWGSRSVRDYSLGFRLVRAVP